MKNDISTKTQLLIVVIVCPLMLAGGAYAFWRYMKLLVYLFGPLS